MDRDPLVRLLLFGILVALVALVVGTGDSGGGAIPGTGGGGASGRYQMDSLRAGSPVLFRLDTQTGRTWKLELRGGRDRWKAIAEPDESVADGDDDEVPAGVRGTPRVPPPPPLDSRPPPFPRPSTPPPLGREGPEWELGLLAHALRDEDQHGEVRIWSASRLALLEADESTHALLAVLGDDDPRLVAAALEALKGRQDPRIPPAVAEARRHAHPAVQAAAEAWSASR